jgi:hypothetical protein
VRRAIQCPRRVASHAERRLRLVDTFCDVRGTCYLDPTKRPRDCSMASPVPLRLAASDSYLGRPFGELSERPGSCTLASIGCTIDGHCSPIVSANYGETFQIGLLRAPLRVSRRITAVSGHYRNMACLGPGIAQRKMPPAQGCTLPSADTARLRIPTTRRSAKFRSCWERRRVLAAGFGLRYTEIPMFGTFANSFIFTYRYWRNTPSR